MKKEKWSPVTSVLTVEWNLQRSNARNKRSVCPVAGYFWIRNLQRTKKVPFELATKFTLLDLCYTTIEHWPRDTPDSTRFNEEKRKLFIRNSYILTVTILVFTSICINFSLYYKGFSQILTTFFSSPGVSCFWVLFLLVCFNMVCVFWLQFVFE